MSRAELIYPFQRILETQMKKVAKDPYNSDLMTRYYKVRICEVNIATVVAEFARLIILSKYLNKRFDEATVEDIEDLVYQIDQRKNAVNTKNKFRKVLKAFYRWLKKHPKGQFPPEVSWITLKKMPLVTVKADDLLSYDECIRISENAMTLRDKALFQCLLDAGCRIGEILTVRVGEVEFNEGGAVLQSDGKTGQQPCILTWSSKILAIWLNNHPFRNDKNAPLWPVLGKERPVQMSYQRARIIFGRCVKKAGYKRRVWLHLLKHVSSTHDAKIGMPDSFRRFKHHWTESSRMPQVYEHLSKDVIPNIQNETWKTINDANPVQQKISENTPLSIFVKCKRCEFENPRDSLFCNRCAFPIVEKQIQESTVMKTKIENMLCRLMEDPEKMRKLLAMTE